jgi:hypothetical protein
MTILYCGNCEKVVYEGLAGRRAADERDFHEFDRGHEVVEFAELGERLVVVIETIEV